MIAVAVHSVSGCVHWNARALTPRVWLSIDMTINPRSRRAPAWYSGTREAFLHTTIDQITNQLAGRAADESLDIEPAQCEEWRKSVDTLQTTLGEKLPLLRTALSTPGCESIRYVILEFDFHRRGLRMDCVLLGDGVLFVVEFKRLKVQRTDRDQVINYAVNLLEFHKVTQDWCREGRAIVVPILALTDGKAVGRPTWAGLAGHSWTSLASKPIECDRSTFSEALRIGIQNRRTDVPVSPESWLSSPFRPSSSILDATLSLYGNHDVVAIHEHAAPQAAIESSVREIRERINLELKQGHYHIVFLSGAPGAGKTLVGLDIVMRGTTSASAVFVTGNAPLVDVLNTALDASYRLQSKSCKDWTPTGYRRSDAMFVTNAASYKIVKAHHYLGRRGTDHRQEDGRVLVFDEAQRTYEKGRRVLGVPLPDHEADLILGAQRNAFPEGGAIVLALVGHNQAIGSRERGIAAWLEAADRLGWSFSISDETLALSEFQTRDKWAAHVNRKKLRNGHLHQSMRYYRNAKVEEWVATVLDGDVPGAKSLAKVLTLEENSILLTRSLMAARQWAKSRTVGGQRSGLIASGQARRLSAEGLFVDFKPDIATWMLAPTSDVRSSNALETVQNQYNIQGMELDFSIVCWDADLRREGDAWAAYKLSGTDWQKDNSLEVAKNGYRVLLTRARQGMVVFVPLGDITGQDITRHVEYYDGVWEYLRDCGAEAL